MDFMVLIQVLDSTIRLAVPLLLCSLAGLFSERAGIFDIGLEGKLLAAAFFSAAAAALAMDPNSYISLGSLKFDTNKYVVWAGKYAVWIGLFFGILASLLFSLLHGLASITFRGNQLISGVAINFLAAGITVLIGQSVFRLGGRTPSLSGDARFKEINFPFAEKVSEVPIMGPIYSELLSGHTILAYLAMLLVPLSWYVLYRTRFGLRLRAVGENPAAVDTAGISVIKLRYMSIIICGLLCGLAGAYLSTGLAAGFVKDMSGGRGFIALAALIFAKWRPWHILTATLLFGLLEAISNRFQNIDIFGLILPIQFMQALPYLLTVVILAGFVGKAIPPLAGGVPYTKE